MTNITSQLDRFRALMFEPSTNLTGYDDESRGETMAVSAYGLGKLLDIVTTVADRDGVDEEWLQDYRARVTDLAKEFDDYDALRFGVVGGLRDFRGPVGPV